MCFLPIEGPSRGLLNDCENFVDSLFATLSNMIKAEFPHTTADTKHAIIAVIKFTTAPPLLPAEAGLHASC